MDYTERRDFLSNSLRLARERLQSLELELDRTRVRRRFLAPPMHDHCTTFIHCVFWQSTNKEVLAGAMETAGLEKQVVE